MLRLLLGVLLVGCGAVEDKSAVDAPPLQDGAPDTAPVRVTMNELRALPDGPVDVILEPSRITYVRGNRNVHLQADTVGPAIFIFVPANGTPPPVAIGNTVELHVTELATFDGNKEITRATILTNDNNASDVGALVQNLTVAPNEDLESELVRIQRGTVTQITPPNTFTVMLTSNVLVELFSPVGGTVGLCPGATFDLLAIVAEFQGRHQVISTVETDFTNVNTQACP